MSVLQTFSRIFSRSRTRKVDLAKRFELNKIPIKASTSIVHLAKEIATGQVYALKLIDPKKTAALRSRYPQSFESEGAIQSMFRDIPEIASVQEFGTTHSDYEFLLLELIPGPSLDQFVESEEESLKLPDRISLMLQMARAIFAVHEKNYIHRDICPRNFLLSKDLKTVKLIDFGLSLPCRSELLEFSNRSGSPAYMAPEIVRRRPIDKRVDLFSFGISIYQLFTGHHPWGTVESSSRAALLHDTQPVVDIREHVPQLNPRLVKAIHSCLEVKVEQRMPNFKNFLAQTGDIKRELER